MLRAQLTDDSAQDVRLAAVTAIGRVAVQNDPEATKFLQASLCNKSLTVSQTAALILVEWAGKGSKFRDVVARLCDAESRTRQQAATDLTKVAMKVDSQVIGLLQSWLTEEARLQRNLLARWPRRMTRKQQTTTADHDRGEVPSQRAFGGPRGHGLRLI